MVRAGRGYPMMCMIHHPPPPVPVVYDATGTGQGATTTSFSWENDISGSAVLAAINLEVHSTTPATVTAACGSTPMTQLAYVQNYGHTPSTGYYMSLAVFGLLSPPTGNQTISITSSATTYSAAGSVSFLNARGFGAPVTNTGTSATATVNTAVNFPQQALVVFGAYGETISAGTTVNPRYDTTYNSNGFLMGDAVLPAASLSANLAASNYWGGAVIPLV